MQSGITEDNMHAQRYKNNDVPFRANKCTLYKIDDITHPFGQPRNGNKLTHNMSTKTIITPTC